MMNQEETIKMTVYRLKRHLYFEEELLFQDDYVHSMMYNARGNNDPHLPFSSQFTFFILFVVAILMRWLMLTFVLEISSIRSVLYR